MQTETDNPQIVRATGLLVIEVVNSNPNGDPDRESDPVLPRNSSGIAEAHSVRDSWPT